MQGIKLRGHSVTYFFNYGCSAINSDVSKQKGKNENRVKGTSLSKAGGLWKGLCLCV